MSWLSIGQYRNPPLPIKPIPQHMKRIVWKKPALFAPLTPKPAPIQSSRWRY